MIPHLLDVPPVALVASECGTTSVRLLPDWGLLLRQLATLDRLRLTLGSHGAWISRCLNLPSMDETPTVLHIVGDNHDVHADVHRWRSAFAVSRSSSRGWGRGIAIFDRAGQKVLEIEVPAAAWPLLDALVTTMASPNQSHDEAVSAAAKYQSTPNDDIDVAGLRAAWDDSTATSFDVMLRQFGVGRAQAYRLAGPTRAEQIDPASLGGVLAHAAGRARPVALRVFSAAASCFYIGPIEVAALRSGWMSVRGPCVATGIRLDRLEQAWSICRPGVDGPSLGLEFFDGDDQRLLSVTLPIDRHVDYL